MPIAVDENDVSLEAPKPQPEAVDESEVSATPLPKATAAPVPGPVAGVRPNVPGLDKYIEPKLTNQEEADAALALKNPEIASSGLSRKDLADAGKTIREKQNPAIESFANRWAIPKIAPSAPSQPNPSSVTKNPEFQGAPYDASTLAAGVAKQQDATTAFSKSVADTAVGLVSPENLAIMLTAEFGGIELKAAANSPKLIRAIEGLPGAENIKKAIDLASRSAIPAVFGTQAAVGSIQAAKEGRPVDSAVDAIMAALSVAGVHESVKGVQEAYPTATERATMSGGQAAATAKAYAEQGANLPASQWAKAVKVDVGDYNGSPAYVQFTGVVDKKPSFDLIDKQTGEVHASGTYDEIQDILHTKGPAPAGVAPPPQAGLPSGKPSSPSGAPQAPGPPVPQPLPSAEPAQGSQPSPSVSPAAAEYTKGDTFDTPSGKITVKGVDGDKITFQKETASGQIITNKGIPKRVFDRIVTPAATVTPAAVATPPPTATQPTAIPTAVQPPEAAPPAQVQAAPTSITAPPVPVVAPVQPPAPQPEASAPAPAEVPVPEIKPAAEPEAAPEAEPAVKPDHEFSSTQVQIPEHLHAAFSAATSRIPDSILAADGRETEPHITVKFGLHGNDAKELEPVLANEGPITATLGKTSIFKTPDADVIKIDVKSPDLHRINAKIASALPNTDTHPTYIPHMTLAYVKPGEGAKFSGKNIPGLTGEQVQFGSVQYSGKDRTKTDVELKGAPEAEAANEPSTTEATTAPTGNAAEATPEPVATESDLEKGTDKLSSLVAKRLELPGAPLGDNVAFQKLARESFGDMEVSPRDKYDALEAGVNRYIQNNARQYLDAPGASGIRLLHSDIENKLPVQTHRTEEQIKEQQFSTPPSLSLLAAKLLHATPNDVVLEPSAGTGNLAVWPKAEGAKIITNELAPRRAGILKMLGFPTRSHDARYINDLLSKKDTPTAVIMNPPFSSDPRSGAHSTTVGIEHVEQALAAMKDGGRLVAILGAKQGDPEAPKVSPLWQKIAKKANIRASIEIDGEAYRKYGTAFGNSVVVIDKTGPTPGATWKDQLKNIVRGHFKSPEEAWDAVQHIAADRSGVQESPGQDEAEGGLAASSPRSGAIQPGQSGGVGTGSVAGERGPATSSSGIPAKSEPSESAADLSSNEPATEPAKTEEHQQQQPSESSPADIRGVEEPKEARERTEEQGGSFVSYNPQRLPDKWGALRHQANIVETASMAAIDPPAITEKPNIDWSLVKNGDISEVQLEAIAYAVQAHNQFLPSGERVGFFVGDGTGVGKGREIAGTILHYWNSGVKRIVWVSYSTDLKEDAERDLRDLKANIPVKLINDFKRNGDITMGDGVVFLTYQSLASGAVGKDVSGNAGVKAFLRLDQLQKWAGDGPVIVFDEAHKAKNSTEERGQRGRQKASDSGLATVGLQAKIPKARVLYSSATGATDVRNLGYASRLGLWGVGSSFDTFDNFRNAIAEGGVGAMEVVARDMKAQGRYLSRFISFAGVDYSEVTHDLTKPQTALYDTAAKAWQTVFQNFNKAIEVTDGGGRARAAAMSAFWGANQRFFRQFVTSMKMPTLLKEIEKARAANKSVVISLMGTGAAQAERELARIKEEEGSLDDLDFSAADTLIKLIEKSFPTVKYVDSADENGNITKVPLMDADGRPVESKEALEMKEQLMTKLQGLRFPEHPIDQIISKFGHENVAELTGRKNQFLTDEKTGKKEVHRRKKEGVPMDKTNISEAKDFQAGKKKIAIISAAASTGISLHADKRAANQERRVHIVLETKWSADTQMQDFGRTHRTNQTTPPEYVLMSSNVGGEKRFLSTIARRLSQLGALTRGQRDAASSGDLAKYNFESEYGTAGTQETLHSLARDRSVKLGFDGDQALVDMGLIKELKDARSADFATVDVPNFLNRTLSLEPARQNKVFSMFMENFERAINLAKERGTFDEGVEDIKSPSIKLVEPEQVVKKQEGTGAKTLYYNMKEGYKPPRRSFDQVTRDNAKLGFAKNLKSGNIYAVDPTLSVETDDVTGATHERVRLSAVNGGNQLVRRSDFNDKYESVKQADAKTWWDTEHDKIPALEYRPLHVIGGSIMPVWNVLQSGAHGLKTVRLKTDEGQYIVGAKIGNDAIGRVLRGLGHNSSTKLSPEDVHDMVMRSGETVDLAGDMKLRRVKLSGEERMEVLNIPYGQDKTIQSFGVSKEFIQHKARYFVNLFDKDSLAGLLKQYPVVGSATGADMAAPKTEAANKPAATKIKDVDAGSIREYSSNRKQIQAGPSGWYQTEFNGKSFYSNGHFIAMGEAPGEKHNGRVPSFDKFLEQHSDVTPSEAVAFSNIEDGKRLIWFDNGVAIDSRYYDFFNKKFPGSTFLAGEEPKGTPIFFVEDHSEPVGVVMPVKTPMPDSVKDIVGTQPHPVVRNPGERGAVNLGDLSNFVDQKFGNQGPKLNYSGLGAKKRVLLPGKQLQEVEEASREEVFPAAVRAGSSAAQASVIMQQGAPAVRKALNGSGIGFDEMRLALVESNLRGKADRFRDFANNALGSTDDEIKQALSPNPDGTPSFTLDLLRNIEGRRGVEEDLAQTASALAASGDWQVAKEFIAQSFNDAASRVAQVMDPPWFDHVSEALQNDEHGKEALGLYKELIADPVSENHEINEGVMSGTYGPLGVYYPLIALSRKPQSGPGRRLAYHAPRNMANNFATGLSEDYDVSTQALTEKIKASFRANDKAALIGALRSSGWAVPEHQAFKNEKNQLYVVGPDGNEYLADRKETSAARTIVKEGKTIHIPARFDAVPKFMVTGLGKILEHGPINPNDVAKGMKWLNYLATKGPMELAFHSTGVLGSMYANTPFLGPSALDKAISLPIIKWFGIRAKLFTFDPQSPESIKKLQIMAKAGALPAKVGSVTYNKEYSENTGAKRERFSFAPLLYGPKGLDTRARIVMYDIWQAFNPNGSVADLHDFVNQIGNYTPEFQGEIETALKHWGIGTFATAGMTRVVNSVQNYVPVGPAWSQGGWQSRAWLLLAASGWAAAAIWFAAHKYLTGKNQDRRTQYGDIPVGGGNGFIDQFRHTQAGDALWGKGPTVGHIRLSYFNDPLSVRGARALGFSGAFEAHNLGASTEQTVEAANKDVINAMTGPAIGPAAKALFTLGTGSEPYISGFRDDRGRSALQLFPAVPKGTKPGLPTYGARAVAAARSLNSFAVDSSENLGELTGLLSPDKNHKGSWMLQQALQLAAPGFIGPATNPYAKSEYLRRQRAASGGK